MLASIEAIAPSIASCVLAKTVATRAHPLRAVLTAHPGTLAKIGGALVVGVVV